MVVTNQGLFFHGEEVKAQEKLRFVWIEESWCSLAFSLQGSMAAFRTPTLIRPLISGLVEVSNMAAMV